MDLSTIKDFKINVWYRGMKLLTVVSIDDHKIVFSNADKITIGEDGSIHLNGTLICNDTDINSNQLLDLYKYILIKKGYKFLE
ncbi:MAG: hypothetical protein E6R13_07315 [Spirochaetes bacterium]|nr:MAG: hypothetical protein E6R13_07315 [Spirochaetota bacterium]